MLTTVIAIGDGDTLKASELADGLLDEDAKLRKRVVIHHIFGRTVLAAWLAPRRKAFLTQFGEVQIGQIARYTDVIGQARQQSALFYTQSGDKVRFQPFEKAQFMTF